MLLWNSILLSTSSDQHIIMFYFHHQMNCLKIVTTDVDIKSITSSLLFPHGAAILFMIKIAVVESSSKIRGNSFNSLIM